MEKCFEKITELKNKMKFVKEMKETIITEEMS